MFLHSDPTVLRVFDSFVVFFLSDPTVAQDDGSDDDFGFDEQADKGEGVVFCVRCFLLFFCTHSLCFYTQTQQRLVMMRVPT